MKRHNCSYLPVVLKPAHSRHAKYILLAVCCSMQECNFALHSCIDMVTPPRVLEKVSGHMSQLKCVHMVCKQGLHAVAAVILCDLKQCVSAA